MPSYIKVLTGFELFLRPKNFKIRTLNGLNNICCRGKVYSQRISHCLNSSERSIADHGKGNKFESFIQFENFIENRRKEAARSYVVQVQSQNSCIELYDYCQRIAPVNSMFYYTCKGNHYVLVEFSDNAECAKIHTHNSQTLSVNTPFMWFRAKKGTKGECLKPQEPLPLTIATEVPTEEEVNTWIAASQTLSDEMEVLYESTRLTELGIRLRMICARQIEMVLAGLFPYSRAIPFGSSVNSFGKDGCDLDLILRYGVPQDETDTNRLVYHSKSCGTNSRGQVQRQMELFGDLLQIHVPGIVGVKRILGARVPIIKCSNEFTGIDADISVSNLSAVYMSELLYLYGHIDPAAKRLIFSLKAWAKAVGLTNPSPGRWITNFSLTLLALFYLQQEKRIPSVDQLIRAAGKEDERHAEDVNCSFARDLQKINFNLIHTNSLAELLGGFFSFYQNFDFNTHGVNLCEGKSITKPDFSPLYIVNPLERGLNVSKNVSTEEVERLRVETRNAIWALETGARLNDLLRPTAESLINRRKYISRMVAVKDLFVDR